MTTLCDVCARPISPKDWEWTSSGGAVHEACMEKDNDQNVRPADSFPMECPGCGKENLVYGSLEVDGDVFQRCSCRGCGCAWLEVYVPNRIEIIRKGDKNA